MINDALLVQRARSDSAEFTHIYDRYVGQIYAYTMREIGDATAAQDVVALTFEKALLQLPRLRQPEQVRGWLYAIARNEIRRHFKRGKWTIPLLDRFFSPLNVEQVVDQRVNFGRIETALHQLSRPDQEVLRLHFFEELTHTEIAAVLGCSTRNVAVKLHRALQRLRQQVQSVDKSAGVKK